MTNAKKRGKCRIAKRARDVGCTSGYPAQVGTHSISEGSVSGISSVGNGSGFDRAAAAGGEFDPCECEQYLKKAGRTITGNVVFCEVYKDGKPGKDERDCFPSKNNAKKRGKCRIAKKPPVCTSSMPPDYDLDDPPDYDPPDYDESGDYGDYGAYVM